MSATYDETSSSDKDWIRAQLGDTTVEPETAAMHSDERILHVLALWPVNRSMALAQLAHEAAAEIRRKPVRVSAGTGGQSASLDYSARIPGLEALAQPYVDWLNAQAAIPDPPPVQPPGSAVGRIRAGGDWKPR